MLRLLADENFNGNIVRGLLLRRPDIDLVNHHEARLDGMDDPNVLQWAAESDRIVLTHDWKTMPDFAFTRIVAGNPMPGVFVLSDRFPIGLAIEEILMLDECSEQAEWNGLVVYLPL